MNDDHDATSGPARSGRIFVPADGPIIEAAKRLRRGQTRSEKLLWERLRRPHMLPWVFRRQHAIGGFVVDFYCAGAQLAVEVDGEIHDQQVERDRARQAVLESLGVRVLRVSADDVERSTDVVVEAIRRKLKDGSPPFPAVGERRKGG